MGLLDYIMDRNKEKQEEAQTQEQASANKAKDDQTVIDRTQTEIAREAEKQREAEERGDSASASRAKERIDELNQQGATLKAEKAALEAVERSAHEMVSVYQSQAQATSQMLDLATAHIAADLAEKAPLPGSVADRKERDLEKQRTEELSRAKPENLPATEMAKVLEVSSQWQQLVDASQVSKSDSSDAGEGGGGNAALRQAAQGQETVQAKGSPTTMREGVTALEGEKKEVPEKESQSQAAPETAVKPVKTPAQERTRRSWER